MIWHLWKHVHVCNRELIVEQLAGLKIMIYPKVPPPEVCYGKQACVDDAYCKRVLEDFLEITRFSRQSNCSFSTDIDIKLALRAY